MNKIALFCLVLVLLATACQQKSGQPGEGSSEENTSMPAEKHRPQFHFTPPSKWMNDPNGMVYLNGEYHLFYQHYPDSTVWGPMHWGHAVSTDLVNWQHLPVALYPDSLGYIFSGSAVYDEQNNSGLGTLENPPLVAIFTFHDPEGEQAGLTDFQTQGIAFSLDQGRTWQQYPGNPVLPNPGIRDFRDPKVFWHSDSQSWVMSLAVADRVHFYRSPDLLNWQFASEFGATAGAHGGVWECPDLFELPVADRPGETRWVLLLSINPGGPNGGSATQYFTGQFDGTTFTSDNPDSTALWLDHGTDNYAGVTWANLPEADSRRLFIGWMSNWDYANVVPTQSWRSAMTVPRQLTLASTPEGIRLVSQPVAELQKLRGEAATRQTIEIADKTALPLQTPAYELQFSTDLAQTSAGRLGLLLQNSQGETVKVYFDREENHFAIDRSQAGKTSFSEKFAGVQTAPRISDSEQLQMHLLVDVASVELFADGGLTCMTAIFFPNEDFTNVSLFAEGGTFGADITAWPLQPATFSPVAAK